MERVTLARWLSIVFHPFVMVGVMVGAAAAGRQTGGEAVRSVGTVVLFTVVPLAVLMWRQVQRGKWENVDASNQDERPILYIVGGVAVVALLGYLLLFRPQSFMVRGVAATFGMMAVCGAITRWIKVSLHLAFAALAATVLGLMRAPMGYVLLAALPAIVWSRIALRRHTPLEVTIGAVIGIATAAAIHYL
jgi:membrane-associated phospholipid phosphatase